MMKIDLLKIFNKVTGAVLGVMLAFITLGIIIGVGMLFLNLGNLIGTSDLAREYQRIISDVLTLFILIELSRSLVDYFTTHRLRMTFIVDAGIVFVLREIMIKIFEHKITTDEIYALSALLFVLGALRIGSVMVYQREKTMMEAAPKRDT
ncbi:MAG: phosphate-starvation-inducible PsiE family protein [Gammaproteobacteria bacterium]|nr:phosphate-starvation-inducible PsiE family protein [Gammaproteobacteria bacterium]